jgi:hypothetical protein
MLTFTKKMLTTLTAYAKIFTVRDDTKRELDELAQLVTRMIDVDITLNETAELCDRIKELCCVFDGKNGHKIYNELEKTSRHAKHY